ncbi:MAG: MFS transporter [Candidatus Wildermuthbacteria bacterium]|nr:MFS transporter [Candidatus Wildermuthbacteria bacterium]
MRFFDPEAITRHATLSHFFLMLGYKTFSMFFPLFLAQKGFSLPQIGYVYLLIYLPLVLAAPFAGFLNHKVRSVYLVTAGIGGYALYSFFMLVIESPVFFFAAQIFLGISAALFFVSFRSILMGARLQNPDSSFGWFYSAPMYGEVLAPAIGALLIWRFGFSGVFAVSLLLHVFNMAFTLIVLLKAKTISLADNVRVQEIKDNYKELGKGFFERAVFPFLAISFIVLVVAGVYRSFFVLFLKDIGWTQEMILLYGSISSLLFVPLSLYIIRFIGRRKSVTNVLGGAYLSAMGSMIFGLFGAVFSFVGILLVMMVREIGLIIANSGRSGLLTRRFPKHPEEAAVADTVFAPLGTAVGSLIAGLIIGFTGFPGLFIGSGILIFLVSSLVWVSRKK